MIADMAIHLRDVVIEQEMEDVAHAGEGSFTSEDDDEDDSTIGGASLQGSQQATKQVLVYEKQQAEQKRTRIRKDCTVQNCINR
jgi:hypothetical protein